jgi:hypothetical protein
VEAVRDRSLPAVGLRIVNDVVYTVGHDQITRLHDLNGDGG